MLTPNLERTASDNIREYLRHKVGQTITSDVVIKDIAEGHGAVTGEFNRLEKAGALVFEKKIARTKIYLVSPKIGKIPLSGRARTKPYTRASNKACNGIKLFKIETGIKIPKKASLVYPFLDMKKGSSFRFSAPDNKNIQLVSDAASRCGKKHNMVFTIRRIGKASGRCWRVK